MAKNGDPGHAGNGRSLFSRVYDHRQAAELSPPEGDGAEVRYPVLWEFLTRTVLDEEHAKEPARLSIQMGPSCFAVELVDASFGVMVSCVAPSLETAFQAIEDTLTGPNPPLRYFRDSELKLKKRKKPPKKTDSV